VITDFHGYFPHYRVHWVCESLRNQFKMLLPISGSLRHATTTLVVETTLLIFQPHGLSIHALIKFCLIYWKP